MVENDSCTHTDAGTTVRSRYRGLSWDKKYQGWRVRIFFAGKQRHVGRYSEEAAAAKAYDKAAVYLYGRNAITNHGLEACQKDPTEVSEFVVMAKKLVQDQMAANYKRRQHNNQHSMHSMPDHCRQPLLSTHAACAPLSMPGMHKGPMQAQMHASQCYLAGQLVPQHAQQQLPMQPSMSAQQAEQHMLLQQAASSPPQVLQAMHVASCQPQLQQTVLMKPWQIPAQPSQQQDMITASVYPTDVCPAANVSTVSSVAWGPAQAGTEVMAGLSFGGACAAPVSTVQACALSTAHCSMGGACAEHGVPQVMHPQQPVQQQVWASTAARSQPGLQQQQQTQGMLLQALHAGPVVTSNCGTMIGQQQLQRMLMQQGPAVAPVTAGVLGPVPTISIAGGMPPACMQEQWTVPAQLIF